MPTSATKITEPEYTAAGLVAINPAGEVLCISRRDDRTVFGTLGGKREPQDEGDPKKTAIREAWEEAKLRVNPEDLVEIYRGMGRTHQCITYLALKYDDSELVTSSDEGDVAWRDFEALTSGPFRDYNTRMLRAMLVKYQELMLCITHPASARCW